MANYSRHALRRNKHLYHFCHESAFSEISERISFFKHGPDHLIITNSEWLEIWAVSGAFGLGSQHCRHTIRRNNIHIISVIIMLFRISLKQLFLKTLETTAPRLHRVQSPCEIPKEWLRFRAGRIRKTIARGPIWPRGQLAPEPTPLSAISWTTIFTTQPPNLWSICTASTYYKRWLLIGESWKGSENLGYENPQQRTYSCPLQNILYTTMPIMSRYLKGYILASSRSVELVLVLYLNTAQSYQNRTMSIST